jgi:hypothetical protein
VDGRTSGKNGRRRRLSRRRSKWPGYIAKVGSKWYPIESITEQLLTRIGQVYGVRIADSQLRIVGSQVRFLSRYFLRRGESLFHGIDLFREYLGDEEIVNDIAECREEQHFYTFQTVLEAVKNTFPDQVAGIMSGMVEMLTFDALVGNNDRHPLNWGVITPTSGPKPPRFSPVFDTARALFWNLDEKTVRSILASDTRLLGYIDRSRPQIGWDQCSRVGHFELIRKIFGCYSEFRTIIDNLVSKDVASETADIVESEFSRLLSDERRRLILHCLQQRQLRLRASLAVDHP